MGNTGKNSNTSQFFITFAALPRLSGKHVVFGKMLHGEDVLALMEQYAATKEGDDKPRVSMVIAGCGLVKE